MGRFRSWFPLIMMFCVTLLSTGHVFSVENNVQSTEKSIVLVELILDGVEGKSREWLLTQGRAGESEVQNVITDAGFEFAEDVTIPEVRENDLLKFRKPVPPESGK